MVTSSPTACVSINRCVACDTPIPTLIVGEGPSRREWECVQCGATYLAGLADEESVFRDRVRLTNYFPQHVQALPNIGQPEPGVELRKHRRRPLTLKVPIIKVNSHFDPIGEDFEILSRNLSESGIGLLHPKPLAGRFVALITLPNLQYAQIVMRIVRCEQMGAMYEMGAKFIKRMK